MKLTKAVKVGLAVTTTLACCTATGVATYKAYPKIKACKDEGKGLGETIKTVAPDYIPVFGTVCLAVGLVVADSVLGEKKIKELENRVKLAASKYDKVSKWYKNQTEAINEQANDKTKEKIFAAAKEKDSNDRLKYDYTTVYKIFDPTCGVHFEASLGDFMAALDILNQKLAVGDGVVTYDEFYQLMGADIPDKYRGWGWSIGTARNQGVLPWIHYGLYSPKVYDNPAIDYDFELYFEGESDDANCDRYKFSFEPVDHPESPEWD